MYVKFFSNKKGGSSASINYLLNEREKEGTAKILKGDRNLTENIIKSISNKQKVTVGVLSFEERNISAAQKEELMQEFEKTIFAGMTPDEYNILWVEHTDKDRLEMNFVIPKIHLPTQKAFNPYYHAVDFPRIEMIEDIYNIKYNLTSKKDPSKAQTLSGSKKELHLFKDYQELDKQLHELVQSQQIQNREQLIELLKESDIEVTRTSKESISVKLPDSKKAKRFKGSIYNEQFTSIEQIEAISEEADRRAKEFQQRDTTRELELTLRKLDKYNEQKAQHNREKYQLKDDRYREAKQETIQSKKLDSNQHSSSDNIHIYRSDTSGLRAEISSSSRVASTTRNEASIRGQKVSNDRKRESNAQQREHDNIHQNRRIDDTRRRTLKRIRARAKTQRESYAEARQSRVELHQAITEQSKKLRAEREQNSIELPREYELIISTARATVKQSSDTIEAVENIDRELTIRERAVNRVASIIERVKDFATGLKERFLTAKENIDESLRSSPSHSYRMR